MAPPKVSVLWVNYNGMHVRDILQESLQAIDALDYDDYELIAVDNGSNDGSCQLIADQFERMRCKRRLIRLDRNLGFTGGNNVAYAARSPEAKYVLLVNSDAVPYPDSLREIIERMEGDSTIGAAQGVTVDYSTGKVDTAGEIVDEVLEVHSLSMGSQPTSVKSTTEITYANGAFAVYRVASLKAAQGDRIFDEIFAYYDDNLLGLKLWNRGFKSLSFPVLAARHRRSSSFGRYSKAMIYLTIRNCLFLNEITNSRYRELIRLFPIKYLLKRIGGNPFATFSISFKAAKDGLSMGRKALSAEGVVDLYRAPIIRLEPSLALLRLLLPGRLTRDLLDQRIGETVNITK
ncbi:MAG: glycosyltransferase family 2 protein [Candidatus Methanosuratincola petrocarbonis]